MTSDVQSADPRARDSPPLDAVDSRWWYWIAAYVGSSVLPIVILVGAFVVSGIVGISVQETAFAGPIVVLGLLFLVLLIAVALVVSAMLPVALYVDARQVGEADLEWQPDPVLYGLLGLLQFIATPLVGFVVAAYYLFRRHEAVGVP